MDRYAGEVEADFHRFYQMDLIDLLRDCQWRKIIALMHHLPEHSATSAARANDDETVFEYFDYLENNPELKKQLQMQGRNPPLEGYTREARKLDQVSADLRALIGLVNSALGGKMKIPDVVVPESAADRWHRRRSEQKMNDLFAEVAEAQQRWRVKHAK